MGGGDISKFFRYTSLSHAANRYFFSAAYIWGFLIQYSGFPSVSAFFAISEEV